MQDFLFSFTHFLVSTDFVFKKKNKQNIFSYILFLCTKRIRQLKIPGYKHATDIFLEPSLLIFFCNCDIRIF